MSAVLTEAPCGCKTYADETKYLCLSHCYTTAKIFKGPDPKPLPTKKKGKRK